MWIYRETGVYNANKTRGYTEKQGYIMHTQACGYTEAQEYIMQKQACGYTEEQEYTMQTKIIKRRGHRNAGKERDDDR